METKKTFRTRMQILLPALLVFLILTTNIISFLYYKDTRQKLEDSYINNLVAEYEIIMGVYSDLSDFMFQTRINKNDIIELFNQGVNENNEWEKDILRKELFNRLNEFYTLSQTYNFRQLHFHESDNTSFLRFHSPENFGDDLTGIRATVEYANREQQIARGFEEGRIFNGYRFVYPLSSESQHIGSVEVSVSMKTVIDQFRKQFDQNTQFIIRKEQMEKKVFTSEQNRYSPWFADTSFLTDKEISPYCFLEEQLTPSENSKLSKVLEENQNSNQPFCMEIRLKSGFSILTFLPILNFSGENVAYIFTQVDADDIKSAELSFYLISLLLSLLIVAIILFAYYYHYSQKRMEKLATYDHLTKTFVRRVIMELSDKEFDRFKRYHSPYSLIMIDIDHFKQVNDKFGHSTGDIVLTGIAAIINSTIRKTDSLGRYGGEEFLVILPKTEREMAVSVAEKLRKTVAAYDFHKVGKVTISLGAAEIDTSFKTHEELIAKADEHLYAAKELGRNQVVG